MDGPPVEEATHQVGAGQSENLILAIEDLRRRVEALERRSESTRLPPEPARELPAVLPAPALPAPLIEASTFSSGLLEGLGRVLLGLAGAYLLRAITDANVVPRLGGTLAGVLYASVWLVIAPRRRDNRWMAPLQGFTASAILAPLLWEATIRFHTLTPSAAAAILSGFIILGQIFAWRNDLSSVAAITALAGSATAVALIIATLDPMPFFAGLAIAAVAVEYGACRDRVLGTRWIVALAVNFCAFLLVYLVTRPQGLPEGYAPIPVAAVFAIQWALVAVYLASTIVRTLAHGLAMRWFEMAQLVAIVGLAIGGTLQWAHGTGGAVLAVGAGCLAAGVASYAASAIAQARRLDRDYHAYATFALLLALIGSRLLLTGLALATLWSALALTIAWFGERWRKNVLCVHSAVYLAAAALASNLMSWSPPAASGALLGMSSALLYILTVWNRAGKTPPWPERIPSAIAAALLCWSLVAVTTGSALASRLPASLNSTLRTVVISSLAIVLAWLGSRWCLKELVWLLYPWMAFGAIKLILEDFGRGESATLFVSLLVYGAALIALPHLLQRAKPGAVP
jgi:hypothetical protein